MDQLKLIIRFDDLCPTMNHLIWKKVEGICNQYGILPIIAVIPDNHDPKFFHEVDPTFWYYIKELQSKGWTIGLHGLHHTYVSKESGLMKITDLSEYVPKSVSEQNEMIRQGKVIFEENGINIDMFIAPCHSFDKNTLQALKDNGISVISDGFYSRPVVVDGMTYIPSQLWERSKIPDSGFYTICCHFEHWDYNDIAYFESLIKKYKENIISFSDIGVISPAEISDKWINWMNIKWYMVKKALRRILYWFRNRQTT